MNQLTESLWGDEGFSAMAVQKPFFEMLGVVMRDTAPPLFYILGFVWTRIFGTSELALRSLSLLLIAGTAVFAGLIVYQVQKRKLLATLVGLLTFFTPFLEPFAFEWRMYALLVFTVSGSVYFFVVRKWRLYVFFTLAALYTHHFALFTLAGEGIWFLLTEFNWKRPKTYFSQLWPFFLIGLLYLPWLYPLYLQTVRVKSGGFWLSKPTFKNLTDLFSGFFAGVEKAWYKILLPLVGVILLLAKEWRKIITKFGEILFIFSAPVWLSFLVSYLVTPVFYDRYLLSVSVGIAVLLGMGLKKKFLPLLAGLVVFSAFLSLQRFTHPAKRPFRELAAFVKQEKKAEDFLINYNGQAHHLWESKYYGLEAPIYSPAGPLPLYVGTAQMTEKDTVETLVEVKGRLGVISSEPREKIEIPGFEMIEFRSFGSLNFSWWRES